MKKDTDLAHRLKKKDERALEEIIDQYAQYVAAIIYNISKGSLSREDIEEVTMDVFVTLWNNAEKVQPDKLKGYIACISKTRAKNRLASLKKSDVVDIDDYDPEDSFSISDQTEKKDMCRELLEIVNELKEPDREIIIRHYFYYQKITSIARSLGLRADNVKVILSRTRKKLKLQLTERGYTL